ncbi:hypothetical protein Aduo_004969 [Ancylostoma duodenale]
MCEENSARIAILEEEIQELRKTVESLAAQRSDEEKAADVPEANGGDVMAGDDAPVEENRMEVAEQNQEERSDEPTSSNARNLHSRIRRVTMYNNHRHSPKITPCAYCSNNSHHRALCNAAIAFEERAKKIHHC